jgi:hypothetical protein
VLVDELFDALHEEGGNRPLGCAAIARLLL